MVQIKLKGVVGVETPSLRSVWCGTYLYKGLYIYICIKEKKILCTDIYTQIFSCIQIYIHFIQIYIDKDEQTQICTIFFAVENRFLEKSIP